MITLEDITKVYKRDAHSALDQVDLSTERGEFVLLAGTSGPNKLTLLSLVLREYGVTEGKVMVLDKDSGQISCWKISQLHHQLGVILQDLRLLENKNVYDNAAIALQVIGKLHWVVHRVVPEVL